MYEFANLRTSLGSQVLDIVAFIVLILYPQRGWTRAIPDICFLVLDIIGERQYQLTPSSWRVSIEFLTMKPLLKFIFNNKIGFSLFILSYLTNSFFNITNSELFVGVSSPGSLLSVADF
jgi:hypothetical protein